MSNRISKLFGHGRKTKPKASEPPPNLISPQASSSAVGSYNTTSDWNNYLGLGSRGIPERDPLQRVPENVVDYRRPAELATSGSSLSWVNVPITPHQPRYYGQREQQPQPPPQLQPQPQPQPQPQAKQQAQQQQQRPITIVDEASMHRARQANDIIVQRNEEKRILERRRNASADNVRHLRELIRERYALDLYIWEHRSVLKAVRRKVEPVCKKADAILQEIYFIVNAWDEDLFDEQEWQTVKRIKARLSTKPQENGESGDPAIWGDLAPWDRRDSDDHRSRAIEQG